MSFQSAVCLKLSPLSWFKKKKKKKALQYKRIVEKKVPFFYWQLEAFCPFQNFFGQSPIYAVLPHSSTSMDASVLPALTLILF